MTIYNFTRDGKTSIFKNTRRVIIISSSAFGLWGFGLMAYSDIFDLWIIVISALTFLTFGNYSTHKYFQKLEEQLASTEYELGEDYILFRQMHRPDLRISREEITRISNRNGLQFQTESLFKSILIPKHIDGFNELKAKVSNWSPIEETAIYGRRQLRVPIFIIIVGSIVTFSMIALAPKNWAETLITISVLIFIGLFAWIDINRTDLTKRKRQFKIFFHFIFMLFMAYIAIDLLIGNAV